MNISSGVSTSRLDALDVWSIKKAMDAQASQTIDIVSKTLDKQQEGQAAQAKDPIRGKVVDVRV